MASDYSHHFPVCLALVSNPNPIAHALSLEILYILWPAHLSKGSISIFSSVDGTFTGKSGPHLALVKDHHDGTSLMFQWLRLHTPKAGGQGLITGQGTGSHMPQLKSSRHVKDPACHNIDPVQSNKYFLKYIWYVY